MLNERLANLSIQKVQKSLFEYLHLHTLTYKQWQMEVDMLVVIIDYLMQRINTLGKINYVLS